MNIQIDFDLVPSPVRELVQAAIKALNEDANTEESLELLHKIMEMEPTWAAGYYLIATSLCASSYHQGSCAILAEGEKYALKAVLLDPNNTEYLDILARAKALQGRLSDTYDLRRRIAELNPNSAQHQNNAAHAALADDNHALAQSHFFQALAIDSNNSVALNYLSALKALSQAPIEQKLSRWPSSARKLGNSIEEAVRRHILVQYDYPKILKEDSTIITIGSCFAQYVANRLRHEGYDAQNVALSEAINNSYSNRYFIDWMLGDNHSAGAKQIDRVMLEDRESIKNRFKKANIVVYTLGVAPAFFHPTSGEIFIPASGVTDVRELMSGYIYRNTSVQENVINIRYIIKKIRELKSDVEFVMTLSPVPLNATFGKKSVFQADCLSKSTLRVAVEEIMNAEKSGVNYWPSFEAVRWLGAYMGPMYGQEDNSTSHVSEEIVKIMTTLFVEKYSST